jgi:hypothetical protein
MQAENVSIPCGTITLEGALERPDSAGPSTPGAVICHPHPVYGGTMDNNVVMALRDAFMQKGIVCLRFNFRGTGRSQGSHDDGSAERDDVKAALDFLERTEGIDTSKLMLGGYSFGCWVGFRAASEDTRPKLLVGVGPPVNMYDYEFLKHEARPKLLIAGDRDFVCAVDRFNTLMDGIPEPKKQVIIPGADHFHFGREHYIVNEIVTFLNEHGF